MIENERDDWGDDGELGSLLDAYAGDRLRSDPAAVGRVRARVMAEAHRRPAAAADALPALAVVSRPRAVLRIFRVPAAAAAALLLVGLLAAGGAIAGSAPGGPLYGVRLWAEELTLPSDAAARAEAELARLEARLAEAREAAAAGNGGAVTAALEAYRREAGAALDAAGTDPTRQEHLAVELGRHVTVLRALVGEVPGRASEAIQRAVERSEQRIEEILSRPPASPGAPGKPEATPRPTPKGKPDATPKPTPPGKPEATPVGPAATPGKPEATPTAKPTPAKPEATPKPKPTPKPRPSPAIKSTPAP